MILRKKTVKSVFSFSSLCLLFFLFFSFLLKLLRNGRMGQRIYIQSYPYTRSSGRYKCICMGCSSYHTWLHIGVCILFVPWDRIFVRSQFDLTRAHHSVFFFILPKISSYLEHLSVSLFNLFFFRGCLIIVVSVFGVFPPHSSK